jgi:proline-specific peptidase
MRILRLAGFWFLFFLVTFITYLVGLIITFLFGSSWYTNSAYTLALIPAIIAISVGIIILVIFPVHSNQKTITRLSPGIAVFSLYLLAGCGLLGYFDHKQEHNQNSSDVQSGFINSKGVSLYYHQSIPDKKDAPAILVLHGGPGSGSYSIRAALCDSLDKQFRMVYFDQRATGRSSWADSFTLDDYMNDMESIRKALNIKTWYLLSVSWGTVLAHEYTTRYPEQVEGIINWGGLISSQAETRTMIHNLIEYYTESNDSLEVSFWNNWMNQSKPYNRLQTLRVLNRVNQLGIKSTYDKAQQTKRIIEYRRRAMQEWNYTKGELGTNLWATCVTLMQLNLEHYDFSSKLILIKKPYLFLIGERDPQMNKDDINRYMQLMPGASLEIIENSGHIIDNPEDMIHALQTFIIREESKHTKEQKAE